MAVDPANDSRRLLFVYGVAAGVLSTDAPFLPETRERLYRELLALGPLLQALVQLGDEHPEDLQRIFAETTRDG